MTKKYFYHYFTQPWSVVESTLADFAALGRELGNTPDHNNKMWHFAVQLHELITTEKDEPDRFALKPIEKAALHMLDTQGMREVLSAVRKVQQILSGGLVDAVIAARDVAVGTDLGEARLADELLAAVGVEAEVSTTWQKQFARQSQAAQRAMVRELQRVEATGSRLQVQIAQVATVCGVVPYQNLAPYSPEELPALLTQKSEPGGEPPVDVFRFIRTCTESMRNEDRKPLVDVCMGVLSAPSFVGYDSLYSWSENLLFVLMMHAVWYRFDALSDEYQNALLQHYIYRAVVCDVPVREHLQAVVYHTITPVSFMTANARIYEALRNSSDYVPLDEVIREVTQVGIIVQTKIEAAKAFVADGYVKELYGQSQNDTHQAFKQWLGELVSLILDAKEAQLVEQNKAGELTPRDRAFNDMMNLIAHFGIGAVGSDVIVEYFKHDSSRVSLDVFLRQIHDIADIKKDITIQNCADLADALHEASLLSKDEEIVEFHEDDGEFHWNEALLRSV